MRSHASAHETICNDAITGQRKTAIFLGVEIFSKSGRNGLERMRIFLMHLFFWEEGGRGPIFLSRKIPKIIC